MESNICKLEKGTKTLDAIFLESEKVAKYNDLNHKQTGYSKRSLNGGYVHYNLNNEIVGTSTVSFNGFIHT